MSRPGSKQALVIDILKQQGDTTLADIVAATGWLPHTSRAALTGLRKKVMRSAARSWTAPPANEIKAAA